MLEKSGKKQASLMHYLLVGACTLFLLISNFSPWLSIAGIASISGAKTDFGIFIFISVVFLVFYVASGIAKDTGLLKYLNVIKILSLASASVALGCLVYFIIRLSSIKEQYFPNENASSDLGDLGDLGEALQETIDSLTQALTPRLGSGLYLAFATLVTVLVIIILEFPKDRPVDRPETD
jgi:hypothetical protein